MVGSGLMRNVAESLRPRNVCVQVFVAFASFGVLVCSVVLGLVFWHDIHARFWLGELPAYALWASALAVAPLLHLLGYGAALAFYRGLQRRAQGASSMGGAPPEKRFCYAMTARGLSRVCLLVLLFASLAVVLGSGMLYLGSIISDALMNRCGASGISYQLEHALSSLVDFRAECYSSSKSEGKPVNFCPGFQDTFPPPSPFVTYLKVLEENLECTGFCTKTEGRLFALDPAQGAAGDACGPRLARVLWKVALLSGAPALAVGFLSGLAAWVLCRHDEL
jgi:hypothetical protein